MNNISTREDNLNLRVFDERNFGREVLQMDRIVSRVARPIHLEHIPGKYSEICRPYLNLL